MSRRSSANVLGGIGSPSGVRKSSRRPAAFFSLGSKPRMPSRILSTPNGVQKLQKALHAKAKTEAGYRFYALHDKISREDILAHAYAQCRSNKGAPGVDGQDFADVEALNLI
jgi:hypothetical protein